MAYSREELIEEAKRRGMKVKEPSSNPYSREELMAEARRRGIKFKDTGAKKGGGVEQIGRELKESVGNAAGDIWNVIRHPKESANRLYEAAGPFLEESLASAKQARENPSRAINNLIGSLATGAEKLYDIPANVSDYFASRLAPEYEGKVPRGKEIFGMAQDLLGIPRPESHYLPELQEGQPKQPGDVGIRAFGESAPSLLAGGPVRIAATHALMNNEDPIRAAIDAAAIKRGIGAAANIPKGLQKAYDFTQDIGGGGTARELAASYIAKKYGHNIPLQEIVKNAEALEGAPTGLGRVLEAPGLTKFHENVTSNIPFGGGQDILAATRSHLTSKADRIAKGPGALFQYVSPDQVIHQLGLTAKKAQTQRKNELFAPVRRMEKKEKFKLNLKNASQLAKEQMGVIEDTPYYKNDPKFRKEFNTLLNIANPSENVMSPIVGPNGKPLISKQNTTSIVAARTTAQKLDQAAEKLSKSTVADDRSRAGIFERLAKAIRADVKQEIKERGSKELQKADKIARENYGKNFSPFVDKEINKLMNGEGLSETFIRDVMQPGKSADRAARITKFKALLPESQQHLLGQAYLSTAIDAEGNVNPNLLKQRIGSLGKRQFAALFEPRTQKQLQNFMRLMKLNPEAANAMFNAMNGQRVTTQLGTGLFDVAAGLSGGGLAGAAFSFGAKAFGARMFNKMMSDPEFMKKVIAQIEEQQKKAKKP